MKARRPSSDQWISMLPNGQRAEYESKRLASGKYWICASVVGKTSTQSKVVDFPVDRTDVETVFLSDLIGSAA
jgi:hypothetical protein